MNRVRSIALIAIFLLAGCGTLDSSGQGFEPTPIPSTTVAPESPASATVALPATPQPYPAPVIAIPTPNPPRPYPAPATAAPPVELPEPSPVPASLPGNRPRLQLCVATLDGTAPSQGAVKKIAAALDEVSKQPYFALAGLNQGGGPTVIAGCPSPSPLKTERGRVYVVTEPSPIFTFVFIATEEELQGVTFKGFPRVMAQEVMCEGDDCGEVTKAVYITRAELDNREILVRAITACVGLRPLDQGQESNPIYVDGVTPNRVTPNVQESSLTPAPQD
ncbi:MAG TPA: hypothetical protein VF909_16380 [Roseiflexaceae bacterium]